MTLPELCEYSENQENTMPNSNEVDKIGKALKTLLQQACAQGRVTCSLASCVDLLATRPDDVMLCVMPQLHHPDAAATIQSTLIRAVCQEHCIRVLAVDCDVKLAKAVCSEGEGGEGGVVVVDDNSNELFKLPSACSEDSSPTSTSSSSTSTTLITDCDNMAPVMGFPCVLVQYPADGTSAEDEMVAEFCKEQFYGNSMNDPYVELPD